MALPNSWLPFVFPPSLRADLNWTSAFAKNRRSYVLGYAAAAIRVGRTSIESVKAELSPAFAEDPRRYIPVDGWRGLLKPNGEYFADGKMYQRPPITPMHSSCPKWGQFGKDQPEHAWLKRPMRLFDALKAIAALYDAHDQTGVGAVPLPSPDGFSHAPGEMSIHPALFQVPDFDADYYNINFAGNSALCQKLAKACGLYHTYHGRETRTFYEISRGLSCTWRTAEGILKFVASEGLPAIGSIELDWSARGTNRSARQIVKNERKDSMAEFSSDCAVEIFTN